MNAHRILKGLRIFGEQSKLSRFNLAFCESYPVFVCKLDQFVIVVKKEKQKDGEYEREVEEEDDKTRQRWQFGQVQTCSCCRGLLKIRVESAPF